METKLKYRMVGILVLTALAVIFVPMIFSGSEQDRDAYMAEIPKGPSFGQGRRISVIDLQAEMRSRERESAAAMPVDKVDQADYADQPAKILDQNGLPIGWSLQVASFRDQENAVRLRASIRQLGHGSYVLRSLTNEGLFFQVLVGPSLDRNALLKIGQQLSAEMDLSVQIVRYRVEDDSNQLGG
ncbi:MAG: SPOR domain-containing protein [Pseudomonadales bacterium]